MFQELIRFNRLIHVIKTSLADMIKALQGLVVMSASLEDVHISLNINRVPNVWKGKSYPSLKPLSSYIVDLNARLKVLQDWIDSGPPTVFWLSGFYFTQSFLTGVLQNFSRAHHYSIDLIHFEFTVTDYMRDVASGPKFGVYIKVSSYLLLIITIVKTVIKDLRILAYSINYY